jgi:hypothetical protein
MRRTRLKVVRVDRERRAVDGARRGAGDDLKRTAYGVQLGERAQRAHLVRRPRAASRQNQARQWAFAVEHLALLCHRGREFRRTISPALAPMGGEPA